MACALPAFRLRDETPVEWTVKPGAAAQVRYTVSQPQVPAGSTVDVDCEIVDSFGNLVEPSGVEVVFTPRSDGLSSRDGRRYTVTEIGRFDVTCVVPGVAQTVSAPLMVTPGPASELSVAAFPTSRSTEPARF